jgi:hypothetical protein
VLPASGRERHDISAAYAGSSSRRGALPVSKGVVSDHFRAPVSAGGIAAGSLEKGQPQRVTAWRSLTISDRNLAGDVVVPSRALNSSGT